MQFNFNRVFRIGIVLLLCLSASFALADINEVDVATTKKVAAAIFAVAEHLPVDYTWPPAFEVDGKDMTINAYSTQGPAEAKETKAQFLPKVVVLGGLLDKLVKDPVAGFDADYLAFVIGHETAHLLHGDCRDNPAISKTPFLRTTFTRQQELAADSTGMELAVKAGYSFQKALKGIHRMAEANLNYSSFEGLGVDHPSWDDRLANLDKEQAAYWHAMSAFNNGTVFLMVEQYNSAELCFQRVTKEFPTCYEAWANLGYARLMNYCDNLDNESLKKFAISQIVVGGFYMRPKSLANVRGINEELWWKAVGALRESLRLHPEQPLVKANLGVAYLVHPQGFSDIGQATQFLQDAVATLGSDKELGPLERAAILLNAGVAAIADGKLDASITNLDLAAKESGQEFDARGQLVLLAGKVKRLQPTGALNAALLYSRAQILARSQKDEDRQQAVELLENYLSNSSPASAWWELAYEQYQGLCKAFNLTAKTQTQLRKSQAGLRPITSLTLDNGKVLMLSESIEDVKTALGTAEEIPVMAGISSLKRLRYAQFGIELITDDRQVLAIALASEHAPSVELRRNGLGAKVLTLTLGISRDDVEKILGSEDFDYRPTTDPDVNYRFYRNLGLAIRIKQGVVVEVLVVEIPIDEP